MRADEVASDERFAGGGRDRAVDVDLLRVHRIAETIDRQVLDGHVARGHFQTRCRECVSTGELEFWTIDLVQCK